MLHRRRRSTLLVERKVGIALGFFEKTDLVVGLALGNLLSACRQHVGEDGGDALCSRSGVALLNVVASTLKSRETRRAVPVRVRPRVLGPNAESDCGEEDAFTA
jgi:uncharacterized membrane protein (UPF0136 family)